MIEPVTYVIDTREQRPYALAPAVRRALPAGDYSVVGLETRIAVERKTLADLVGTLTRGRKRFEAELARLSGYGSGHAIVVIEATMDGLLAHRYASGIAPGAVLGLIGRLETRHGIPFEWAGNRFRATQRTAAFLEQTARHFVVASRSVAGNRA